MTAHITHCESLRKPQFSRGGMALHFAVDELSRVAGNNLKAIRKRMKLTQSAIAERLGVSIPQVSRWEAGGNNIPSDRLSAVAEAYGTSIGEMFATAEEYQPAGPRLFVKGSVAAGRWIDAWRVSEDDWEVYTGRADVSAPVRKRFGLRVVGDSMNMIYPPGTILDCVEYDGSDVIPSGKRVIAVRERGDGSVEATVKELIREENGVEWLVPRSTNPQFQAFRADKPDSPDIARVEIVGIVVASIRPE